MSVEKIVQELQKDLTNTILFETLINHDDIKGITNKFTHKIVKLGFEFEDTQNELLLLLWQIIPKYNFSCKFTTYYYSVCIRFAKDKHRKRNTNKYNQNNNTIDLDEVINFLSTDTADDIINIISEQEYKEYLAIIVEVLKLTPNEYKVLELRYLGYNQVAIAEVMQITKARVNQIVKAIQKKGESNKKFLYELLTF